MTEAMDSDKAYEKDMQSRLYKYGTFTFILSIAAFALIVYFCYLMGLDWDTNDRFHFHPIFMSLGFFVFSGNTLMIFRVFRGPTKITVKVLHALFMFLALACACLGFYAVFSTSPIMLTTAHSWLGLSAFILFGLQWLFGFVTFLFPGLSMAMRGRYKPVHTTWGLMIYLLTSAAILTGLTELTVSGRGTNTYVANAAALLVAVTTGFVTYIVKEPDFVRAPESISPLAGSIQDTKAKTYETTTMAE